MKTTFMFFTLLFPLPLCGVECRAVNLKEFRDAVSHGPDRAVFFASWCSTCSQFITSDRVSNTVFVAVADDKARAEKVLSTYLKDHAAAATCFFDKDESIAKAFKVRNLPFEKSLRDLPKP